MRSTVIFFEFFMVLRRKELYALNRLGIANQVVVDQRNREFIGESVCTSAAIPITELSCRIPLATFHGRGGGEKKSEREREDKKKYVGQASTNSFHDWYKRSSARFTHSLKFFLKWNLTVLWCFLFDVQIEIIFYREFHWILRINLL